MSGTLQSKRPARNGAGADRPSVALVGASGPCRRMAMILAEHGLELDRLATARELLEAGRSPALVVLWANGALVDAVTGELAFLRRAMERTPVVLVCAEIRPGELRAALSGGAAGVVLEAQLATALWPSLEAARVGQVCVPRQHAKQVEPAALSTREKQILGLVVMGYMNSQIAAQLFVAESTVKSHLSSAFGKLGVRSRNEAVELILDSERGLGVGILGLGGEPVETSSTAT